MPSALWQDFWQFVDMQSSQDKCSLKWIPRSLVRLTRSSDPLLDIPKEILCKFLLRWFRDGFLSLLTIYVPLLYLPAFSESNAWDFHLVMTDISGNVPATSEDFRRIIEDFRTLPKIKCPQMFQKTFEHFRSYLKDDTFSAFWHDFVRTQKRTQSHHVLRIICSDLWDVRREIRPWYVTSMS